MVVQNRFQGFEEVSEDKEDYISSYTLQVIIKKNKSINKEDINNIKSKVQLEKTSLFEKRNEKDQNNLNKMMIKALEERVYQMQNDEDNTSNSTIESLRYLIEEENKVFNMNTNNTYKSEELCSNNESNTDNNETNNDKEIKYLSY